MINICRKFPTFVGNFLQISFFMPLRLLFVKNFSQLKTSSTFFIPLRLLFVLEHVSAGAQNVTGTYIIITLVYREVHDVINYACLQALVNNMLTWQNSCVIANNT